MNIPNLSKLTLTVQKAPINLINVSVVNVQGLQKIQID